MSELLEFLRTHEEAFHFRYQRQTNPDGYHANASTWLRALTNAAKAGLIPAPPGAEHDHFVLHTGEELARALQTQEHGRPLALGSAIDDALRRKELISLQDFLDAKQTVYARSWIPTPWQMMRWGLEQLGVLGGDGAEDRLVSGNFVVMANVEAASKAVLEHVSKTSTSNTSRIFSRDLFNKTASAAVGLESLSTKDLSVLLIHLARDRAAIAYDVTTGTVKVKLPSESIPSKIEQEDVTIASIRTRIATMEPQVEVLTDRISELDTKAREAVSSKQLTVAKAALRQKRLAETTLQQRTATLAQLEDVYAKIEQAADQVEMVPIMEASSQTLRSLNQRTGGVEKVQDLAEGLKDEMMTVDEVQQAVNEVSAGAVDEGEVEDELEALEKAEREKVEEAERLDKEKLDLAERTAREKREAEEAEETRRRLAELDHVGHPEQLGTGSAEGQPTQPQEAPGQEMP